MEFTVINKQKKPNSTAITIESKEPYTYYIREFEGDLTGLEDEVLIKRVLDLILIELDPSGAVAKMQTVIKEAQSELEQATNRTIVNSDAMMELTATLSADIAEIKERLHALDGKGATELVAPTAENHETTPVATTGEHHDEVAQPVATTEEKHEETPRPAALVATETPVQPMTKPTLVATLTATPTAETTPTTTVQGDGNNDSNGKVEEHNAETTTSGNNSVQ